MTSSDRLLTLSGESSGIASALLLKIGSGSTAGISLVNYSGLESGTASEHLLTNHVIASLGSAPIRRKERIKPTLIDADELVDEPIGIESVNHLRNEFLSESLAHDLISRAKKRKSRADEEALLLMI